MRTWIKTPFDFTFENVQPSEANANQTLEAQKTKFRDTKYNLNKPVKGAMIMYGPNIPDQGFVMSYLGLGTTYQLSAFSMTFGK